MGIAGHMGLLFDPVDRDATIERLASDHPNVEAFVKSTTNFGLVREDWWQMHRTFEKLAASAPHRGPLARLLVGGRSVGQGPGTDMFHFDVEEIKELVGAAESVSPDDLTMAVDEALMHPDFSARFDQYPASRAALKKHLPVAFAHIRSELQRIATGDFELISFMF